MFLQMSHIISHSKTPPWFLVPNLVPSVILPAANAPAPRRLEFEDVVPVEVGGFKGQTWDRGRSEPALHTTSDPFHGKKNMYHNIYHKNQTKLV